MAHHLSKRKKTKLKIATPKNLAFLLWIAQQKGFLRDHNLNIEFIPMPYGRKGLELLIDEEVDGCIVVETNVAYLGYIRPKKPIKAIVSFEERHADNILINGEDQKPQNLIGKIVGFMPRTTSHSFLIAFLAHHNIPKTSIKLKPLTPQAMPNALIRKEVDAISIWNPICSNTMLSMTELGIPFSHFANNKEFFSSEVVLCVKKEFMIKQKKSLYSLFRATQKAEHYYINHKDECEKILRETVDIQGPHYRQIIHQYDCALKLIGPECQNKVETIAQWIRENDTEFLDQPLPDYDDYLDREFFLDFLTEKI